MAGTRLHPFIAIMSRYPNRRAWLLSFILTLVSGSLPARAAEPAPPPAINLHHTSWTARDGAPPEVLTMAQTTDGWLWLGGASGLFRFDGVRFERFEPAGAPMPATAISILSAQASGAMWIGYRFGGASLLRAGQLRNYSQRDGLPENGPVWGLEYDGDGRMWAATSAGMYYLDGQRWLAAAPSWGLPRTGYKTLMRDRKSVLWAQGDQGAYSLAPGARRFIQATRDSGTGSLFDAPGNGIWSWDARHNQLNRLTPPAHGLRPRDWQVRGDVTSLLFDHAGDLWVGRQSGLESHTARGVSHTGPQQGLSGNAVGALLEDREGNIWAATASGLDRFRGNRLSAVPVPESMGMMPLAADPAGGAWIGRFHVAQPTPAAVTELWPSSANPWHNVVTCDYLAPDGALWAGGHGGLWRKEGAQLRRVALPDGLEGGQINSMVLDRAGGLWLAMHGLYRRDANGSWEEKGGKDGLPEAAPRAMAGVGKDLWFAYPQSRLMQREDGRWRDWGPANGLGIGMVMALHLHGGHVWAGGENGVALRRGDRFIGVAGIGGQAFQGISGIVELDNGDLWLNGGSGLYRIAAAEIARLVGDPGYRVRYERLDSSDGLEGNAPVLLPTPSLIQASDGHLWVSTTAGVFRFDPAFRPAASTPPPVLIRAIGAPGQARAPTAGMRLPPGTDTLQIAYTALALAMPERVRFRYRLEGADRHWQDAGQRRAAYYSNLGPGDYRFRVLASNYDNTWAAEATTLDFSIAPTMVQTWWFRGLCALMLLAACWIGYRLRIRHLAREVALRLEERTNERERIARELHDTLLQSVQGLILHVHAASLRLPAPEPARVMIEKALQQADDVLLEGRDKVRALRSGACATELAEALQAAGANLRPPDGPPLQLQVTGPVRKLHPIVREESLAIASEAIANAYRHAGATQIVAELHYRADKLRLIIRDNGIGLHPDLVLVDERPDHWGLSGMHERAMLIKAKLILHSQPGGGTTWTLTLPGNLAYQTAPRRFWPRTR